MKRINGYKYFGVSIREALLYTGFFAFFSTFYYTALWLNRGGFRVDNDPFFSFRGFLNWGGIDYFLKFLLSLPIWWVIFVRLRDVTLYKRLLIHMIVLPLFVLAWIKLDYL
jgi:two-component system LytT family sensor kinase